MDIRNPGERAERLDTLKENMRHLVDQGQEKMHAFKDRVVDAKRQAAARSNEYFDRVTDFIRRNPIKSVAIAFGAGYIGMRLVRR